MAKTMYEITDDFRAIVSLMENAVDEDGCPRDLNDEEAGWLEREIASTADDFKRKTDGYCKVVRNLELEAKDCEAERSNFKSEMDRLSRRAKSAENRARRLKSVMKYAMELFGLPKMKTELFSLGVQNTALSVFALDGASLENVPERFLKPRELDTAAVKEAIKSGELTACPDSDDPLKAKRVFWTESGELLKDVRCKRDTTLVIR